MKQLLIVNHNNGNRQTIVTTPDMWCERDGKLLASPWDAVCAFPARSFSLDSISYKVVGYSSDFAEILEASGKSMGQFSSDFGIPYRTLQDWKSGARKPPEYVLKLLAEALNLPSA